jgi:hypothetical protein
MEKISSTFGAMQCCTYEANWIMPIPEEIAEGLNWLDSNDEHKDDTLKWTILNDNILILERNKPEKLQWGVGAKQISVKLEIFEDPFGFGVLIIDIPAEIEPSLNWSDTDPVEWIILEKNTVILQRFEPSNERN